ncbi:MAG: hypothetical protein QUS35_08240 [bacterium]|nr:hypothetical protein [bacterium]
MLKKIPFAVTMLAFLAVCGCETDKAPLTRTEDNSGVLLGGQGGMPALGWDTPVPVSATQFKAVQHFTPGDAIYGCDAGLNWRSDTVAYSDGIPPSATNPIRMMFVRYMMNGTQKEVVVRGNTLFLMADGSFKQAQTLSPGNLLQGADGSQVQVQALMAGLWIRGIQSISTSSGSSSDGILIAVNGLLIPDFAYVRSHNL